jgi:hypothetical protein
MAEMWKPKPIEVYQQWIDDILTEASDELTDWETTFISDIEGKLLKKRDLSERQAEVLEKIYVEYTK